MTSIVEALIRRALKPSVASDLPGRLRLKFSMFRLLPEEAVPYMHYLDDAMCILPGVKSAECNVKTGSVLILYDPALTGKRQILSWWSVLTGECIASLSDPSLQLMREDEIVTTLRARLKTHLPSVPEDPA
ncbi:MAG: hypothetical protein IJ083_17605 [Clostridia bacterium]|nr:hypothetical protein [Clostridia bacterium]